MEGWRDGGGFEGSATEMRQAPSPLWPLASGQRCRAPPRIRAPPSPGLANAPHAEEGQRAIGRPPGRVWDGCHGRAPQAGSDRDHKGIRRGECPFVWGMPCQAASNERFHCCGALDIKWAGGLINLTTANKKSQPQETPMIAYLRQLNLLVVFAALQRTSLLEVLLGDVESQN